MLYIGITVYDKKFASGKRGPSRGIEIFHEELKLW